MCWNVNLILILLFLCPFNFILLSEKFTCMVPVSNWIFKRFNMESDVILLEDSDEEVN